MSKEKSKKRKVVVTTKNTGNDTKSGKLNPTVSRVAKGSVAAKSPAADLIFNADNYKLMILGVILVAIGMLLMLGGRMPSPDVWDDNLIYGFRRTVLAPIFILAGLIVEVFAILKK